MNGFKKCITALTSFVMAFSVFSLPVFAEGSNEDNVNNTEENSEEVSMEDVAVQGDTAGNPIDASGIWDSLNQNGYAEVGKYKVEKIKDHVYHMDESTKANPGGTTDADGNMNNPSSIYFVERDDAVLMVDLGNPATGDAEQDAKTIVQQMVGNKPLSIVVTHNHGDHTGLGRSQSVFEGIDVEKVYIAEADSAGAQEALQQFDGKIETLQDGSTFTVSDTTYSVNVVNAHTEGSLMIEDLNDQVLFTGDTFGSGFVWLFWDTNNGNPIAALKNGISKAQNSVKKMTSPSILAGHRWQQFWEDNSQRPGEMSIQYLNDMAQVITGLSDGTTVSNAYSAGAMSGIELSSNGAKAKIDTTQAYVDKYLEEVNKIDDAYIYSATNKLSIETVNNTAAAAIVVYPDDSLSDAEAKQYLEDTGMIDYANSHASSIYVARTDSNGEFTVDGYKNILSKIGVSENLKLVGIGKGATFINEQLSSYMNSVSGVALIDPSGTTGQLSASVPAYISGNADAAQAYINQTEGMTSKKSGSVTTYTSKDHKYGLVVTNSDHLDPVKAYQEAWDKVLSKYARIGNYIESDGIGTWYSRPFVVNGEYDSTRKYQFFESVDGINDIVRTVYTEDLNGNGVKSLWYVYVPEKVKNAKGNVPVVFLMHGNTNDPRTQYDTSGWASVASKEGIILVCPEWQGHTYQGYTYDPMTSDTNFTANSDFITGCYRRVMEDFPQIDTSRVYISGLSAGCRNTTNNGLVNTKYFAAGAGQSGPFMNNADQLAQLQAGVASNKDAYDFPIIYFAGDKDEYLTDWDQLGSSGGLQMAQLYAEMNEMDIPDGNSAENADLYGINWDERYTINSGDDIAVIEGGTMTSKNGAEICMNRIRGWGHWNYAPDAELMWNFMKKYTRNSENGSLERSDLISGTEKMYVTGEDWGPAVRKVMLTVDKTVNASDLHVENFTVNETKESTNWADGSVYNATAPRTVTNVYLSDEKGNKIDAESGNIITVEMYISPSDGSPFRYDLATGSNKWCNYYELAVEGTVGNRTLNIAHVLNLADQSNWITDAAYKFDVTKSFTGSDGVVMPYGQYSPKEDGKKHALVVWLHGAGEGVGAAGQYGNDNYVDLLGNEVTSLASDEFQNLFDGGAYVITPQAQTMWMDSGDGQMQMGEKGSMYEKTLFELIDSVVKNNPGIDPDRVIVGGCSNGGYMTMELILKHPDYFYKAYPICEAYKDENITGEQLKAVKEGGTEIWFTYAKNDTTVDPTITAIPTIERMKKIGIKVHTSVWEDVHDTTGTYKDADGNPYQYAGHWSWIYFFNNENVCDECKKSEWKWMAEYPVSETKPAVKPEQKKDTKNSAKTSDSNNAGLFAGLGFIAVMSCAGILFIRRKYRS